MRCPEARAILWPPEQPRLAQEAVLEARAHLASCSECTAWFRQDRVLLGAYTRLAAEGAPDEVRERVFDALARARATTRSTHRDDATESLPGPPGEERPPRRRRLAAPFLVGSGMVAALLAALILVPADGTPERAAAGEVFVEDHLRRTVGEEHILTSDPAAVRTFLARELGVTVAVLSQAGLELEGAEICLLEGERGAVIIYRMGDARISHYLVPRMEAEVRAPRLSDASSVAPGGLLPVVTWSSPRVEQALVGELPADELLRIARAGRGDGF